MRGYRYVISLDSRAVRVLVGVFLVVPFLSREIDPAYEMSPAVLLPSNGVEVDMSSGTVNFGRYGIYAYTQRGGMRTQSMALMGRIAAYTGDMVVGTIKRRGWKVSGITDVIPSDRGFCSRHDHGTPRKGAFVCGTRFVNQEERSGLLRFFIVAFVKFSNGLYITNDIQPVSCFEHDISLRNNHLSFTVNEGDQAAPGHLNVTQCLTNKGRGFCPG